MKAAVLAFSVMIGIAGAAVSAPAGAAPETMRRVGFLLFGNEQTSVHLRAAFIGGLKELGYTEGQNVTYVYGFAGKDAGAFGAKARELAQSKVDVIVTASSVATNAARSYAPGIPIVLAAIGDAVGSHYVNSLAEPGANITGISIFSPLLNGKRLEFTKEALPDITRVAILQDSNNPANSLMAQDIGPTAQTLGLTIRTFQVRKPDEFDNVFAAMAEWRAQAVVVFAEAMFNSNRDQLVASAMKQKLPLGCPYRDMAAAGCLFSYGVDLLANFHRAAFYVDKILRGVRPADLPVENPTRFEMVINMKTARDLGLSIPLATALRADERIDPVN